MYIPISAFGHFGTDQGTDQSMIKSRPFSTSSVPKISCDRFSGKYHGLMMITDREWRDFPQ